MPGIITTIALLIKELMVFVSYVKNNAFPQPFTDKEEEKYLKHLKEGDAEARRTQPTFSFAYSKDSVNTKRCQKNVESIWLQSSFTLEKQVRYGGKVIVKKEVRNVHIK